MVQGFKPTADFQSELPEIMTQWDGAEGDPQIAMCKG